MTLNYICISDLHCGAENSLLTPNEGSKSEPVDLIKVIGTALADLVKTIDPDANPDLILLGDAIDLSFSPPAIANAVLVGVLKSLFGSAESPHLCPFERVIFVPGNHDHELWTAERFSKKSDAPQTFSYWSHTTPAFKAPEDMGTSNVLDEALTLAGLSTPVHVYYPNFGLRNADHSKAIILHHGHYFESLYLSMSRLGAAVSGGHSYPKTLEVMEKANGAFVDFIWSTVGDSGQMGSDVSLAYQYLLSGGAAAYFQRRIAALLTTTMLSKMPLPQVGPVRDTLQDINTGIVDYVAGSFGQLARFSYQTSLTYDTAGGIADYMNGPTVAQFKQEQMDEPPNDMSLIFGHTHKPFEDRLALDAYPNAVGVVNTGGWVLDTTLLATVEGASAVFIDDDLNVGVLKLFAPPANGETIPVSVSGFDGPGTENPMVDKLKSALAATQEQWDKVAEVAAETYTAKQTHIIKLLEAADAEARRKEALL